MRFPDGESSINHLSLFVLPPKLLKTTSKKVYDKHIKNINEFYNILNLDIESELWYNLYLEDKSFDKKSIRELFNETSLFPSIQKCFKILLMFPVTTCSIERPFSSMTRIKTLMPTTGTEAGGAEDEESAIVKEFFKQQYMKTEDMRNIEKS